MARNTACTVFIGNLDEKVSERVLYEILIQVGRVVDLHIPRDKETSRHKGYAFAEYETEEIAGYAIRLFSGLVRLHNRTLRFAMSGQDKSSQNAGTTVTPKTIPPLPKNYSMHARDTFEMSQESSRPVINGKIAYGDSVVSPVYPQASTDGLVSRGLSNGSFEYSRRVFGAMLNNVSHPGSRQSFAYPSY